ncbi:MAG: hybrid sensor histidine kinase/response regulator [Gemmatimonadetes bacterium]|nr:hybrid sensor histidine kinase/response regulator [Gemmatimonadota bacterium]
MTSLPDPKQGAPDAHRDKINRALKGRARLEMIRRTELLEAGDSIPALLRAARVAARALRAKVAQVNILTDRLLLPIAVHTEPDEDNAAWRKRRRAGNSYCKYVVWSRQPFIVGDASKNPYVRNGHATRELGIVSYLGVPILGPAEDRSKAPVLGTLCVVDRVQREWTDTDVEILTDIANGVSDEIEYRLHSRTEVRAAKRQTLRLLDNVGIGVLSTDALGVITYANPAAMRMLGYSAEELIGHDQHGLIHHTHPDGSRYNEASCPNCQSRIEGRTHRASSDTFWKSDGSPLMVDSLMTPVFDRGEVVATVLTFENVSAQAAERRARIAAERANRAKTELLAAMSYELRGPVSAIAEHADRLENTMIDIATAEQRAELRSILRSQQHLLGLIENMAGFATLEAGPEAGE